MSIYSEQSFKNICFLHNSYTQHKLNHLLVEEKNKRTNFQFWPSLVTEQHIFLFRKDKSHKRIRAAKEKKYTTQQNPILLHNFCSTLVAIKLSKIQETKLLLRYLHQSYHLPKTGISICFHSSHT